MLINLMSGILCELSLGISRWMFLVVYGIVLVVVGMLSMFMFLGVLMGL